ncbi:hypothetical protein DERP_002502 [Dermatophagoides pteronyssinus]|uniref:Uncharacterized protein n=1 Tax=Dermatophagoides pteronyssinus TaxID=6956 RepID=A0ABQ8JHW7_DERPT|nr:hypothetical protein DERP_002502 [Dermatophagoides pteronyssinus]
MELELNSNQTYDYGSIDDDATQQNFKQGRALRADLIKCCFFSNSNVDDFDLIDSKIIRNDLRARAFEQWCRLSVKGAGIVLFNESPWTRMLELVQNFTAP